jgi:hypothetical protein
MGWSGRAIDASWCWLESLFLHGFSLANATHFATPLGDVGLDGGCRAAPADSSSRGAGGHVEGTPIEFSCR